MAYEDLTDDDLLTMVLDAEAEAVCTECGAAHVVEPDASGYDCGECDGRETVTSPLVALGII